MLSQGKTYFHSYFFNFSHSNTRDTYKNKIMHSQQQQHNNTHNSRSEYNFQPARQYQQGVRQPAGVAASYRKGQTKTEPEHFFIKHQIF